jgi:uncharacterized secreted repeat protein (TIGR03808 family)
MQFNRRTLTFAGLGLGFWSAPALSPALSKSKIGGGLAANTTDLIIDSDRDQTATLQRLIDEAANRKTTLTLPPGRFLVTTLELRPSLRIQGAGSNTTLASTGGGAMLVGDQADGLRIEGLTLDGQLKPLDAARAKGLITISRTTALRLTDVTMRDSLLNGIALTDCSGAVTACTITSTALAAIFSTDARGLEISNNAIAGSANNGILAWRTKVGDDGTIIAGNRIERISAAGGGTGQNGNGINVYRAGNVLVTGNRISDCAYTAVRGNAASNIQIIANNCQRLGEVALYAEFGFQGALIANNLVDTAATGVSVTNFNEGGRLAVIQGNLIRNLVRREQEPEDKRGDGIAVEADAVVTGNTIENAATSGIMIGWGRYMRDVTATSNLIRNARVGIGVTGDTGAGAVMITANMISGAKDGAIRAHKLGQPYGPDLALSRTENARVLIERNMAI